MILTECAVFFSMLVAGGAAAVAATALLALGGSSRLSRVVFDFLTPLAVGAVFFFALYLFAGGVFRLYAVLAFLSGWVGARLLLKKFSPVLKRIFLRAAVPITSFERKMEKLFSPVTERLKKRRETRLRRRAENAIRRAEKRAEHRLLRAERKEKRRQKQKLLAYRKSLCAKGKGKAERLAGGRPVRQSD